MALTIRPRQASDVEGCVATMEAVHTATGYPVRGTASAYDFLVSSDDLQTWVAEKDGQILGQATVGGKNLNDCSVALWLEQGRTEDIRTFKRLFVHPESHGLGIARRLCNAAVQYADENGFRLVLFVLYEKFPGAMKMYEKLGWERYGETVFKPSPDKSIPTACYVSPSTVRSRES